MGKILSVISRPLRNYNVENRAHKVISKEKPIAAPGYQANIQAAEQLLKENPESYEALLKKDPVLEVNLKDIYVKSYDPDIPETINKDLNPDRPLPLDRRQVLQTEFGYLEPKIIPPGKITLRQTIKLLTTYTNSDSWNSKIESSNYNIDDKVIDNIVKYFRIYKIYIPDDKKVAFGTPVLPKQRIDPGKQSSDS